MQHGVLLLPLHPYMCRDGQKVTPFPPNSIFSNLANPPLAFPSGFNKCPGIDIYQGSSGYPAGNVGQQPRLMPGFGNAGKLRKLFVRLLLHLSPCGPTTP